MRNDSAADRLWYLIYDAPGIGADVPITAIVKHLLANSAELTQIVAQAAAEEGIKANKEKAEK